MRAIKRRFALALSLLLFLAQSAVGLAEDAGVQTIGDAYEAGREIVYQAKADWAGLPLLDDETNDLIASLLGVIEVSGSYGAGQDGGPSYGNFDLRMQGQSALSVQTVMDEDAIYIVSPVYARPIAIEFEKLPTILSNLGAYLDSMAEGAEGSVSEMSDMYGDMIEGFLSGEEAALPLVDGSEEILNALDIDSIIAVLEAWAETALEAEDYEEEVVSVLNVEIADANFYEIDKAELVQLITDLAPILRDNTDFWTAIMESGMVNTDGEEIDIDETIAEIRDMLDEMPTELENNLPEDLVVRYTEALNASGEYVMGGLDVYVPAASEEEQDFALYLEWQADGKGFYFYANEGGDGVSLWLQSDPTEVSVADGATVTDDYFGGMLSVYEDDEVTTEIMLSLSSQITETEGARGKEWMFLISMSDGSEEYGLEVYSTNNVAYDGTDATSETTVEVSLVAGEETMPILTLTSAAASGEPEGPAFDVEAMQADFLRLGDMTEEEFIEWMNVDQMNALMQLAMQVMTLLPEDVSALLLGSDEVPKG